MKARILYCGDGRYKAMYKRMLGWKYLTAIENSHFEDYVVVRYFNSAEEALEALVEVRKKSVRLI